MSVELEGDSSLFHPERPEDFHRVRAALGVKAPKGESLDFVPHKRRQQLVKLPHLQPTADILHSPAQNLFWK